MAEQVDDSVQVQPGVEALAQAHPRVQHGDPVAEVGAEAADGLRRQGDLRDENEGRLALDEREFLQGRRELELEEFQCRLEERDRDLAGQEAEMDQRQAALRECAQQVSLA